MSSDTDTVFVTMYHPSLGNAQVLAPLLAVPTYQSHGWLLLDPAATPPPVATPYLTQAAADSRYVRDWAGAETVTAGAVRVAPSGQVIVRNADGTSRASYDATEQGAWTAVGGQTAAQLAADPALRAAFGLGATVTDTAVVSFIGTNGTQTRGELLSEFGRAAPVLSNFSYDPTTGNLLSYQEDGITITLTYNADGTVATSKRGSDATQTYSYSGGNLVGVA